MDHFVQLLPEIRHLVHSTYSFCGIFAHLFPHDPKAEQGAEILRFRSFKAYIMKDVYITRIAKFLPNKPVDNEQMEEKLGVIDGKVSKARRLVLRNNKIKTRYYAIDENGKVTHNLSLIHISEPTRRTP